MAEHGMDKKTEPLVTRQELAQILDHHPQTISKWQDAGMPIEKRGSRGNPSLYSEAAVREWLEAREEAAKNGQHYDVAQERARKERAQALLAEQKLAMLAKELIPREEAEKALLALISSARARLLAWPTTLADRLHRASTRGGIRELEETLKAEVDRLLREFSESAVPLKPKTRKSRKK